MIFKKAALFAWILLFTFWCMLRVYFNAWLKGAQKTQAANARISRSWGMGLVKRLGASITFQGSPISSTPTLFVGNHMSYLDVPVFFTLRSATFVAKREVARWPIFGLATTSVGTVYVDRDSVKSRSATVQAMRSAIRERGQSIVIFPEGTSALSGKPWRHGALRMAEEAEFWVQPFTIYYHPVRTAAYIDDDHLTTHLWHWIGSTRFKVTIYFFEPRKITDYREQTLEIQTLVQTKWQELHEEATGMHHTSGA